jgi:hypothetical protein
MKDGGHGARVSLSGLRGRRGRVRDRTQTMLTRLTEMIDVFSRFISRSSVC